YRRTYHLCGERGGELATIHVSPRYKSHRSWLGTAASQRRPRHVLVWLGRHDAGRLHAPRDCRDLVSTPLCQNPVVSGLVAAAVGAANSRLRADAVLEPLTAMRNYSLLVVAVLTLSGASAKSGGIVDEHGDEGDTVFFGTVKDSRGVAIEGAHV